MTNENIRCLIIDDDPFIRDLLMDKLSQYIPEVTVVNSAKSGLEGIQKIETYQPDLIFLDVEMADMTGFEMLSKIGNINFQTIFITSYSHYAIKAIRFDALDYLVKPFDLGELTNAIKRYKNKTKKQEQKKYLTNALHNYRTMDISEYKLILQTQEGELRLKIKDIIRIEGERNYSYIYLRNNSKKLVTKTLAALEELLSDKGFFRCHKSFIVNASHIIAQPNSFTLLLSGNIEVPVSRRKRIAFELWFKNESGNKEIKK